MLKNNQVLDLEQETSKPTVDFGSIFLNNDRILVRFKKPNLTPKEGIYIPYSQHGEIFHQGYAIRIGPGYPSPSFDDPSSKDSILEKNKETKGSYIPLQFKEGDLLMFSTKEAIEILIDGEHYYIIRDQDIEFLVRDNDLFN